MTRPSAIAIAAVSALAGALVFARAEPAPAAAPLSSVRIAPARDDASRGDAAGVDLDRAFVVQRGDEARAESPRGMAADANEPIDPSRAPHAPIRSRRR